MNGADTAKRLTLGEIATRGREKAQDPAASTWFRQSLWTAFSRDPVDAANDAKALAKFLSWRAAAMAKTITAAGLSVLAIATNDLHGRAIGPAYGLPTQGPRLELRQSGMLREMDFGPDVITPAGRKAILEARKHRRN